MQTSSSSTRRQAFTRLASALAAGLVVSEPTAAHEAGEDVTVRPLFKKELAGHPGEEVSMTIVDIPPGASSKPHRHHGPAFIYVVGGVVEMQTSDGPLSTVRAGETFYEAPGVVHVVSRNPSATAPAKLLAFIVGKAGTPNTLPADKTDQ